MKNTSRKNLKKYLNNGNFFNREFSWLEFNRRVLEEIMNPDLPLLEKVKFVSIFHSNLDEFYMIRVSGLYEQMRANVLDLSIDGLTPAEQLMKIDKEVKPMLEQIVTCWDEVIIPELGKNRINIVDYSRLNRREKNRLKAYFKEEIFPVLTPLAFDPGRPFPYISNLSISFALLIKKPNGEQHFARLKIPKILPRLIRVDSLMPNKKGNNDQPCAKFIWVDQLILYNLPQMFPGIEIIHAHRFRITRNTDLEIQEDEADDLLNLIEENIKLRKFGSVVRLEVTKNMPQFMLDTLIENLQVSKDAIHYVENLMGLSDVIELYDLPFPNLKDKPYHPVVPNILDDEENIFTQLKKSDILLHHPYDSFGPVINLIKEAVRDPDVLAIKQTLYRVGPDSPIIKYLIEATERNKQVAVLVELKARFDEQNNIFWARKLENAGAHVVYGLVGLKTHTKMTLIVRKELDAVKRYAHLGTGNYNPTTAKIYTDLGLFTADENICTDVADIFNYLTGYSEQKKFKKLFVAPVGMREKFLDLIQREIRNKRKGGEGRLIFKMNALVDPLIISALYEASSYGVKVDLIVRGICCLIPQVPGLSDNIRVISIVGRYLEHTRIYYFYNGGKSEMYSGSADLMQRNLDRRVETIFPIENKAHQEYLLNYVLEPALLDNQKGRILLPTGKYVYNRRVFTEKKMNLQEWLMEKAGSISS